MKSEIRDIQTFYAPELNALVKQLLTKDPLSRPNINDILAHPLNAPVV